MEGKGRLVARQNAARYCIYKEMWEKSVEEKEIRGRDDRKKGRGRVLITMDIYKAQKPTTQSPTEKNGRMKKDGEKESSYGKAAKGEERKKSIRSFRSFVQVMRHRRVWIIGVRCVGLVGSCEAS